MAKNQNTAGIRLNKYIADCGIASRRHADLLIADGKVIVNGKKVFELGQKVIPGQDKITVNGKPIKLETRKVYIMFYKPKDVVTSMSDPDSRPCVGDYFKDFPVRLFPVGRLDWDSEGLLLMTNDGDFSQKVSHPKEEIPKIYHVKLNEKIEEEKIEKLLRGVSIIGGKVAAKSVKRIKKSKTQKEWLEVCITEGKNRQIRKMFEKVGKDVIKLHRVGIGKLDVGNLDKGKYKELTARQIEKVFESFLEKPKKVKQVLSVKKQMATESAKKTLASKRDSAGSKKPRRSNKKKTSTHSRGNK